MNLILSQHLQPVLMRWGMSNTLMAFDFDGTLAPIVDDPANARLPVATWQSLDELAQLADVAVVSGRSCSSLSARLPASVRWQVGNHGNEGLPWHAGDAAAQSRVCLLWQRQIEEALMRHPAMKGVHIENKGMTLAVHHRHCADPVQAEVWLRRLLGSLQPAPQLIPGILVTNVLPPRAHTKLEALQELQGHLGSAHVLFVGDDVTDELAFAQAPASWLTIKVGLGEATRASYRVRHPADVCSLIQRLVQIRHQAQRRINRLQGRTGGGGSKGGAAVVGNGMTGGVGGGFGRDVEDAQPRQGNRVL
jgi:trehalose 6-phosphate phosphatase